MWFRYAAVLCLLSGDAVTASTLSVVACLCSSTHWYPLWPPTHTPPSPTRPTHLPVCQLFTVPSPQAHGRVQVWVLRLLGGSQASAQTTHAPAHCGLVKLWHSRGDLTSQVSLLRYVIFLAWLHVADCSAVLPAVTFVSLVKIAHQCPGWNGIWSTTYCSLPVTASTWQSDLTDLTVQQNVMVSVEAQSGLMVIKAWVIYVSHTQWTWNNQSNLTA